MAAGGVCGSLTCRFNGFTVIDESMATLSPWDPRKKNSAPIKLGTVAVRLRKGIGAGAGAHTHLIAASANDFCVKTGLNASHYANNTDCQQPWHEGGNRVDS